MTAAQETSAVGGERGAQVSVLLTDILRLMDVSARTELKDMPDGGIGVAVHFEGEVPGVVAGKRSQLVDSLQFLVNKVVNRPNVERRWVTLGVGAFPEPRDNRPAPAPAASAPPTPSVTVDGVKKPRRGEKPTKAEALAAKASAPASARAPKGNGRPAKAELPPVGNRAEPVGDNKSGRRERDARRHQDAARGTADESDEATRAVEPSKAMTALSVSLSKKAAALGRPFAVLMLSQDDRARVVQAARGVEGVTVKGEGSRHVRRVAFMPHKAVPMPKRSVMMDFDDEEDEEG